MASLERHLPKAPTLLRYGIPSFVPWSAKRTTQAQELASARSKYPITALLQCWHVT